HNGREVELEPRVLLGQRYGRWMTVANVIGEYESHLSGEEKGVIERTLRLTAGCSREIGARFALGGEGGYEHSVEDVSPKPAAWFFGPTLNLQTEKVQLSFGWHAQVRGTPDTAAGFNLDDFPRSDVRLLVGVDL